MTRLEYHVVIFFRGSFCWMADNDLGVIENLNAR